MSENPNTEFLMEKRIVRLEGEINHLMLLELKDRMMFLRTQSAAPITMMVDSPGGDTLAALNFCDFMEFYLNTHVHGIVTGSCDSAATFLYLYCTKRLCFPHARFVIHSSEMGGVALKTNPASRTHRAQLDKDLDSIHERVTQMYMRKLGIKRELVEEYVLRGEQPFNAGMWAEEAVEIGLVQEIVTAPLDIFTDT